MELACEDLHRGWRLMLFCQYKELVEAATKLSVTENWRRVRRFRPGPKVRASFSVCTRGVRTCTGSYTYCTVHALRLRCKASHALQTVVDGTSLSYWLRPLQRQRVSM